MIQLITVTLLYSNCCELNISVHKFRSWPSEWVSSLRLETVLQLKIISEGSGFGRNEFDLIIMPIQSQMVSINAWGLYILISFYWRRRRLSCVARFMMYHACDSSFSELPFCRCICVHFLSFHFGCSNSLTLRWTEQHFSVAKKSLRNRWRAGT